MGAPLATKFHGGRIAHGAESLARARSRRRVRVSAQRWEGPFPFTQQTQEAGRMFPRFFLTITLVMLGASSTPFAFSQTTDSPAIESQSYTDAALKSFALAAI